MSERIAELGSRLRSVEQQSEFVHSPQNICPNLLELAQFFHTDGGRVFSDFMWDYVGHPDPLQRLTGQQPRLERRGIEMGRELYSGFSPNGTLLHIRMTHEWPDNEHKFLVALSRDGKPVQEARLIRASRRVSDERATTEVHMMDGVLGRSWPPLMRPGTPSQWRLHVDHGPEDTHVRVRFGTQGDEVFYPLDQLTQALEALKREPLRRVGNLSLVHSDVRAPAASMSQLVV